MLNVLKKIALLTYTPGSPGTPGSPYIPAVPGHYETVYDCSGVTVEVDLIDPSISFVTIIFRSVIGVSVTYSKVNTADVGAFIQPYCKSSYVWVPGTPAVPAVAPTPATQGQVLSSNNIGWNAGAISSIGFANSGAFTFKISTMSAGAVVGLAADNNRVGINDITHGFYYAQSTGLAIMEAGSLKKTGISYSEGIELKIMRANGAVTYWVDGTKVLSSVTQSTGTVFLDVSLYAAGDFVYDPGVVNVQTLRGVAAATASSALSRNVRGRASSAASVVHGSIRNGVNVDLLGVASAVAAHQATANGILQLSAKN